MNLARDRGALLAPIEIEAIKFNQEIIKRLADNSQKIKNYFLATSAIFFALLGKNAIDMNWRTWVAFTIIVVCFWYMDAKYLQMERKFRAHHHSMVCGAVQPLDEWDFDPKRYSVAPILKIMLSFSELIYPLMLVCMLLFI